MPRRSSEFAIGSVRMPRAIAVLIGAVVLTSVAAAILGRNGVLALGSWLYLLPQAVLQGQVWRLLTWPFLENDPIGLLFGCYTLFWVGRDLIDDLGERRFLLRAFMLTLLTACITTGLALLWPVLSAQGVWPVVSGLVVMWGLTFRSRSINLFGLAPLPGLRLAQLTVGLTVLYAVFVGLAPFVPHFVAQAIVFVWMGPWSRWQRGRKPRTTTKPQGNGQVFSFADWHEEHNRSKKN